MLPSFSHELPRQAIHQRPAYLLVQHHNGRNDPEDHSNAPENDLTGDLQALVPQSFHGKGRPRPLWPQQFVDGRHGGVQPILRGSANTHPRNILPRKCCFKPLVHLVANVLPVTQAILDKRNFIAC